MVGGGIGGLAAAVDLATSGLQVTLFERADTLGGKVRTARVGGTDVDAGPTVLTMRWVFDELFARAGRSLERYVALHPAPLLARHFWPDGRSLDLFADAEASRAAIEAQFGPEEGDGFARFLAAARRIYDTVEGPFLRAQRPTIASVARTVPRVGLRALLGIDAMRPMWAALGDFFRTPELRQLFGRYATYCGSSPFEAPGTLNLVAHVEASGVYRVAGGMIALAAGLERLVRDLGVRIVTGAEVEAIDVRAGAARGVRVRGDGAAEADVVVVNADVSALGAGLLGDAVRAAARPTEPAGRSLSALTWALVGDAAGRPLDHHNVFFSADYAEEFRAMIRQRRVPDAPTVYACAQDRAEDGAVRTQAGERMLLVVNAPATGDDPTAWTDHEVRRCEEATFRSLERCGLALRPRALLCTTPRDFAARFPATGGALYGPAARGALSSFARSGARTRVPGLYLAGGSVHPGPGVPMAALSGALAAAAARDDLRARASRRTARGDGQGRASW